MSQYASTFIRFFPRSLFLFTFQSVFERKYLAHFNTTIFIYLVIDMHLAITRCLICLEYRPCLSHNWKYWVIVVYMKMFFSHGLSNEWQVEVHSSILAKEILFLLIRHLVCVLMVFRIGVESTVVAWISLLVLLTRWKKPSMLFSIKMVVLPSPTHLRSLNHIKRRIFVCLFFHWRY
jgi:hypothetical protein